jgi:hypothetical protein
MTPDNALRQAHMTAHDYASNTVRDLCGILDIDQSEVGWQDQLAPFASVLASMVTAAAMDFDTAMRCGAVDGFRRDAA